ncbi:MAG TPA: hypothetical protein VGA99_06835 [bacterium]
MKRNAQKILYSLLAMLYILHTDWWFWNDARLVFNLPVGFLYHIGYCLVATMVMFLLVKFAWPSHLDMEREH